MGFVLGVPLATSVGSAVGCRVAFGALVGVALLLVLFTSVLHKVTSDAITRGVHFRAWRRSGPLNVGIVNIVLFGGHYIAYTYIASLLGLAGVEEHAVGSVLLLPGDTGIIAAGIVVDRMPRVGMLVTVAIMAVSLATLTISTGSLVMTLVAVGAWCLDFGGAPSFLTTAAIRTVAVSPDIAGPP